MVVPGLGGKARARLLASWKSQGRLCAYCCAVPADTVDHVVPLSRGGDNFEGNLAPACRRCNASKCDLLVIEWRTGRRVAAGQWREWERAEPKRRLKAVRGVQQVLSTCCICGSLYQGERKTCGDKHCQREHAGRLVRDRYRAEHGIPVDPDEPTLYWIKLHGLPDTRRRVVPKQPAAHWRRLIKEAG